ncbi:MAG: cytochrome c oxidase assembly protein [Rhodobacteraceae bacterium]|nr:cytochrome c oxidase assembly protein [Paracoccaceae bacterium]
MTMRPQERTALTLFGVAALMVSLSFAAVPFYSWFCKTTGYGGTTGTAAAGPSADKVLDQTVKVRFDATIARGMPWEFRPVQMEMTVKLGQTALAYYEAYNPTDRTIGGQAVFNVTPDAAGGYFDKIQCFCFTEQVLRPHERVSMPVSFFVDPAILQDEDGRYVKEITLSYTMYEQPLPQDQASNAPVQGQPVN